MQNIYGVSYSAKENKDCYETLLKLNGYSGTVTPNKGTIQIYSLQDLRAATAELAAGTSIEEVRNKYSPLQESKKGEYYEENADGNYVFDLTVVSEMDVNNMLHERDMTEGKSFTEAALGEIETISEKDAAELLRINDILGSMAANTTVVDEIALIDTLRANDVSDDNIELYLTTAFKMDEATAAEIMRRNDLNPGNSYDKVCEKAKEISEIIGDGTGKNGLQTIDNMPEFPDCDKVSTKAVLQAAYHMFGDNRLGEMLNGSYTKAALNSLKQTPAENQSYAIGDIVFAGSDGTLPGIVVGINEDGTLQVVQGGLSKDKINNGILENTVSPNKISGFIALGAQEEIKASEAQEQAEKRLADIEEQKTIKNLEEKIQILGYDSKIQEYELSNITGITTVRLETGEIFEISGEENAENISGFIDEQTSIEIVSDGKINNANKKAYEYVQQLLDNGYEVSCETNDKEVKITTTLNGQEVTYTYTPTENNDGFTFIREQNGQKTISTLDLDGKLKEETIILKNDENDGTESESKITYAYSENGEKTITSYENLNQEDFNTYTPDEIKEAVNRYFSIEELKDVTFDYSDGEVRITDNEGNSYHFYNFGKENEQYVMIKKDVYGNELELITKHGAKVTYDEQGQAATIENGTWDDIWALAPDEIKDAVKNNFTEEELEGATFNYSNGEVTITDNEGNKLGLITANGTKVTYDEQGQVTTFEGGYNDFYNNAPEDVRDSVAQYFNHYIPNGEIFEYSDGEVRITDNEGNSYSFYNFGKENEHYAMIKKDVNGNVLESITKHGAKVTYVGQQVATIENGTWKDILALAPSKAEIIEKNLGNSPYNEATYEYTNGVVYFNINGTDFMIDEDNTIYALDDNGEPTAAIKVNGETIAY